MTHLSQWLTAAGLVLMSTAPSCTGSAVTDPAFHDTPVVSGLDAPGALKFTADGGFFVAQKSGIIFFYRSLNDADPVTVVDLRAQVMSFWDRGIMSLEIHPNFPAVPKLWVLYTHDAPIGGAAPVYHDNDNRPLGAASARLSSLSLAPTGTGGWISTHERVLIEDWCQVFPSHSVGDVKFGPDGALYVSAGDAASFGEIDTGQFENFCGDPADEGGAIRSQDAFTPGDSQTLDGTLIRVDPDTGAALPDNPRAALPDENARRVISYGFRNPYRFTFMPGTSQIFVGDVGWNTWEMLKHIPDPLQVNNFGWPCYEGNEVHDLYSSNPLCQALYATAAAEPATWTPPYYQYRHNEESGGTSPCGGGGAAVTGVAFYTGDRYPSEYRNALFLADYGRNCIWALPPSAEGGMPNAAAPRAFTFDAHGPTDLQMGPGGDLYYLSINEGTIRRITYGLALPDEEPENPDPRAPLPTILEPTNETLVAGAGTSVLFAGTATDADGAALPDSALTWNIIIHHCNDLDATDCHSHGMLELDGQAGGSFLMPRDHEAPSYVRIKLTARWVEAGEIHTGFTSRTVTYAN